MTSNSASAAETNLSRSSEANSSSANETQLEAQSDERTISSINHSVCKWCYSDLSVEELAVASKAMGISSVELLDPEDWPILSKYDLTCAMSNPPTVSDRGFIVYGFNRREHHELLVPAYKERLVEVANAGYPNLICFSGNREGLDDEEGLENCLVGLQQIMPEAERLGVTVCMELLNSKVDHGDYQCDYSEWGVELVQRVESDRFKLLYDIYHMQIMEGDVIRTLTNNSDYIGHYHTGGNPGRNEIDETQELNYRAIMKAIVGTGFSGFVAQEFIPKNDPLTSLKAAVDLCSV
ncbi:MAG: TIM barrel protein [Rhodothermales bacterium]|nr:TIM barrel protein [Rhodothermales bacterium]